ncbi:hypothetical protein AB0424_14990 [Streptomyces sp. NPDC051180]|uniref:hypothetical protein n=1 Tax=Streptomyces sp. NPDC051180 TaxID=3155797 RepID=UPI00344D92E7
MTRTENEADQIVFRWDSENLSGSTGFGPVAWSGPREEVENLFRISGPVLRATGDETRPALIRLQRTAGVMLIRRAPFTDAGGGTSVLCHALVGSADLLTPSTCLGLHAWDWEGAAAIDAARVRGRLRPVPEEALGSEAVGRGLGGLERRLPDVAGELVGVVAEFLRHPTERFTVLDERGDTAYPVLWGLHGMFGGTTKRRWTFATHDTVELTELRFVFVGRWSGAASRNTDRRRVDPGDRYGDRAEAVATGLVHHHLRAVAEGQEYAVAGTLHATASARRGTLLDTAARALDTLDRRTGDPGPRTPPPVAAPRTPPAPGPARDHRPPEPEEPDHRPPGVDRPDRRPPDVGGPDHRPSGVDRSGRPPADRDDEGPWPPREANPYVPSPPSAPERGSEANPYVPVTRPAPERAPTAPDRPPTRPTDRPPTPPDRSPTPPDRPPTPPDRSPTASDRSPASAGPPPAAPERPTSPPAPAPLAPAPAPGPDPLAPAPVATAPAPGAAPAGPEEAHRPVSPAGAAPGGVAGDAYPRPVLPGVAAEWTGPGRERGRPWARVRGKGKEGEAETGLVHKLPTARDGEEARELVERAGSRELLDVLPRPLEYPVLTALLQEIGRRLPAWEHPLRRELCEVVLARELWAVAPPGAGAHPPEPPQEQRAANAAELYRWAVRPLLGGGDARLGAVAALLSQLRTSPEPSARETFWLIVDGDRPGLPEAVWLTLLKEAYGLPRTPPRPGAPVSPAAVPADDGGNGYTRRFLTRAALLLGGLVVAIVLIGVWGALT